MRPRLRSMSSVPAIPRQLFFLLVSWEWTVWQTLLPDAPGSAWFLGTHPISDTTTGMRNTNKQTMYTFADIRIHLFKKFFFFVLSRSARNKRAAYLSHHAVAVVVMDSIRSNPCPKVWPRGHAWCFCALIPHLMQPLESGTHTSRQRRERMRS